MAVSQVHFRSISLPSRLHPTNSTEFEAELQKLRSFQTSSASPKAALPVSSGDIQSGLLALSELYNSVQQLKQSPSRQSVEQALEGSVELLDSCNAIRELVQMIKENVQDLQSALRRKGLDSCAVQSDVNSYVCLRKKMNKCAAKSLKAFRNLDRNKIGSSASVSELSDLTVATFKGILGFLSWPTTAKPSSWKLVSGLMLNKSVRDHSVVSELAFVDLALSSIQGRNRNSGSSHLVDMQMVQKRLQDLEASIEGIEEGLERLFRQLIQTRVVLLNILTDH